MANFKVGSRVMCNPIHTHWPAVLRNRIGIVRRVHGDDHYHVEWEGLGPEFSGAYTDWGLVAAPVNPDNILGNFPKRTDPGE